MSRAKSIYDRPVPRGTRRGTIALACAAALAAAGLPALAQEMQVEQSEQVAALSSAQFNIGDRLQISFFEHLELAQPTPANGDTGAATMRTFYQRLDLTGDYRVDMDGSITIPLLGQFKVKGLTTQQLREEIATAFERETGSSGEVQVTVSERQPVFVMGVVRNPGSYPYSPGMITLQAVALAGGYEKLPEGATQQLEARRERERLEQASRRLQRLTAQRARLLEERDGTPMTASHPMLNEENADLGRLLEGERELVEADAELRRGESELQKTALEGAEGELSVLKDSLDLIDRQIEVRSERLRVLQQMQGRGVTNLEVVWAAQKDVMDVELQREQLVSAMHAADQKVAQANLALAKIDSDHRASLARQLVSIEDEIASLETTIETAGDLVRTLEAMAAARGIGPNDEISIEILRRTEDGVVTMAGADGSELLPGDVVNVNVRRATDLRTAQANR